MSSKEKFKTMHNVFDEHTNRLLFKLISQGYFSGLESPISIGKEANIFSAITKENKRIVIKIYRLESCDFNRMYDYLKLDVRYSNIKKNKRSNIFTWTQREYRNLFLAREANVKVPQPITFKDNILVEEFIGDNDPSPKLNKKTPINKKEFFDKIIKNMKNLYKAKLVHADLSPFNILNYNEEPVFIDMSTCTTIEGSRAEEYLERDVRNVCIFFNKLGLKIDEKKILKQIQNNKT